MPGPNVVRTEYISKGVDFGLETFVCHMKDVVMFTLSERRVEVDQRRVEVGASTAVFAECVCVWWGLGCCYGRALGKLQDVHLAAGHRAHYHSRTWSHQRTEERANILLKCHSQQACERSRKHIHKRPTTHTHTQGIYTTTKNMAARYSVIICLGPIQMLTGSTREA